MRQGLLRVLILTGLLVAILPHPVSAAPLMVAGERWCPPETGFCAENAFYDFWRSHGALEILGYPIDSARRAPNGQVIQFYERAVMEWHPEKSTEFQVLLTRLGAFYVGDRPVTRQPAVPCSANCALFAETNHTLRDAFLNYWQGYGGLPVYGFPLTEQGQERNAADGQVYTVQYFERNRFEYHPEHAGTRYEVQLGRLGAEFLDAIGAEVRTYPTVTVPNYGGGTAPPAPTPQPTPPPIPQPPAPTPAPTPPPAPANLVVTIAPASGPAGTKFIATGRNFPAGATITWVISNAAAQTTSGTFQMVPGTTTFDFPINTEGTPPGVYTVTFAANGSVGGSAAFTITGSASASPATYRAQNAAAIQLMHSGVEEILQPCAIYGGPTCASAIQRGYPKLTQGAATLRALTPSPACTALHTASLRFVAADEAFFAKQQAEGPTYDPIGGLLHTQYEVAAASAARDAWARELQYGTCR